jgi:hypothetical protein
MYGITGARLDNGVGAAWSAQVVLIAAVGNAGRDANDRVRVPCTMANVVCVGARPGTSGSMARPTSNYGVAV